jgi:hypothetical protein
MYLGANNLACDISLPLSKHQGCAQIDIFLDSDGPGIDDDHATIGLAIT